MMKMKNITLTEPEGSEIVTIYGYNGEKERYELLATIDYEGDIYHIFTLFISDAEIDTSTPYDAQVVKQVIKENGAKAYDEVQDNELSIILFDMFQEERNAKLRLKYSDG